MGEKEDNDLINKAAIVIADAQIFLAAYKSGETARMADKLMLLEYTIPAWLREWAERRKQNSSS